MLRFGLLLSLSMILAACSTSVTYLKPLPAEFSGNMHVTKIDVTAGTSSPTTVDDQLKTAVEAALAKRKSGDVPITLRLVVTEYQIKGQASRALAGALAGANTMNVSVEVLDKLDEVRSKFDVARSSNPGGYGAFYDQEVATIQAVAEGIVNALFGEQSSVSR